MKNVVIIPVYKAFPNHEETISFKQCLKILKDHIICIVTHESLEIKFYTDLLKAKNINYFIKIFDCKYFNSLDGYNQLLLSRHFYRRFQKFNYLLIYQLDSYVFKDELNFWCQLGYDYVGAPWLLNDEDGTIILNYEWVGNGGFSLRRTKKFIQALSWPFPLYKPSYLRHEIDLTNNSNFFRKVFYYLALCFGYKNTVSYVKKINNINEDAFWSSVFHDSWIKLKIAPPEVALRFSFEKLPSFLYELNEKDLPFGCHGWEKYDFDTFWSHHINYNFTD